jgi:hypothetical protein
MKRASDTCEVTSSGFHRTERKNEAVIIVK